VLEGLGYDVLATAVPRREIYAQSFGRPIPARISPKPAGAVAGLRELAAGRGDLRADATW